MSGPSNRDQLKAVYYLVCGTATNHGMSYTQREDYLKLLMSGGVHASMVTKWASYVEANKFAELQDGTLKMAQDSAEYWKNAYADLCKDLNEVAQFMDARVGAKLPEAILAAAKDLKSRDEKSQIIAKASREIIGEIREAAGLTDGDGVDVVAQVAGMRKDLEHKGCLNTIAGLKAALLKADKQQDDIWAEIKRTQLIEKNETAAQVIKKMAERLVAYRKQLEQNQNSTVPNMLCDIIETLKDEPSMKAGASAPDVVRDVKNNRDDLRTALQTRNQEAADYQQRAEQLSGQLSVSQRDLTRAQNEVKVAIARLRCVLPVGNDF